MTIAITRSPSAFTAGWEACPIIAKETIPAGVEELKTALAQTGPAWLIVTSPHTFTVLEDEGIAIPDHVRIACVGPGTAKNAPRAEFVGPQPASAATFAAAFDRAGLPMIFPTSEQAGPVIESMGATRINLYRPVVDDRELDRLEEVNPDIVIVTSPSAARALGERDTAYSWIAMGGPTARTLADYGWHAEIAPEPTRDALLGLIERMS